MWFLRDRRTHLDEPVLLTRLFFWAMKSLQAHFEEKQKQDATLLVLIPEKSFSRAARQFPRREGKGPDQRWIALGQGAASRSVFDLIGASWQRGDAGSKGERGESCAGEVADLATVAGGQGRWHVLGALLPKHLLWQQCSQVARSMGASYWLPKSPNLG